jgi:ATP-dependent Clp protease ATP-binding subunit ClpA
VEAKLGNRYSCATYSIIHHSRLEAEALGVPTGLSTKHMLLALLYDSQSKAVQTLLRLGTSVESIRLEIDAQVERQDEKPLPAGPDEAGHRALEQAWSRYCENPTDKHMTEYDDVRCSLGFYKMHPAWDAVYSAFNEARRLGDLDRIEPHHLLLALIREKRGLASRVFARLNLSFTRVYEALRDVR